MQLLKRTLLASAFIALALPAFAQQGGPKKYGPGVTDTEIKIGQTMSYSGAAATYGTFGRVMVAYFKELNDKGGINGRKINLMSVDDGFSPPKTVEMTRKLVESDNVLFMCCSMGTGPNASVQKYLNDRKVPQVFVLSGATRFTDAKTAPWTMSFSPTYIDEGREAARYILRTKPNAKIALLYANDDSGKDTAIGFKEGLGADKVKMIVSEQTYEVTDATIDSQIRQAKASGADAFFDSTAAKFTAQAIRIAHDIGWQRLHVTTNNSSSIAQVLQPAGFDKSQGLVAGKFIKEPTDKQWDNDPRMKAWRDWMTKNYPEGLKTDWWNVYGYMVAETLANVIRTAGNDLTRENIMKIALSMNYDSPYLLPGLKIQTSPTVRSAVNKLRYYRFQGDQWMMIKE
ncbi:ABC transporter substrate-binding protein [Ramlibacter sp.]|uniref:ABC transporter substrate-binding protein n=1 Tax=Ramlibacter sp. TaxID=1917967 RepID=UPI003D0F92F3